jgi:hypothetical protein
MRPICTVSVRSHLSGSRVYRNLCNSVALAVMRKCHRLSGRHPAPDTPPMSPTRRAIAVATSLLRVAVAGSGSGDAARATQEGVPDSPAYHLPK